MQDITFVKEFIDEIIETEGIDRSKLKDNGTVYYCNKANGTLFSYREYQSSCEFAVFWTNSRTAISVFVSENLLCGNYFDETVPLHHPVMHEVHEKRHQENLRTVCEFLQGSFDEHGKWNYPIKNFKLTDWARV